MDKEKELEKELKETKDKLNLLISKIKERIKVDEDLKNSFDSTKEQRMYLKARILFCRRLLFMIGEEEKI